MEEPEWPVFRQQDYRIRRLFDVLLAHQGFPLSVTQLVHKVGFYRTKYGRGNPVELEKKALKRRIQTLNKRLPEPWVVTLMPQGYALIEDNL